MISHFPFHDKLFALFYEFNKDVAKSKSLWVIPKTHQFSFYHPNVRELQKSSINKEKI